MSHGADDLQQRQLGIKVLGQLLFQALSDARCDIMKVQVLEFGKTVRQAEWTTTARENSLQTLITLLGWSSCGSTFCPCESRTSAQSLNFSQRRDSLFLSSDQKTPCFSSPAPSKCRRSRPWSALKTSPILTASTGIRIISLRLHRAWLRSMTVRGDH